MYHFILYKEKIKRGFALITVYMVITSFVILSVGLLSKAISERNIGLRNRLETEAFYLAEGAIENTIASFRQAIADYQIPPNITMYTVTTNFTTFYNASVNAIVSSIEDSDRLIREGNTSILVRNYEVNATAYHPQNSAIRVTVHQIIARRLIPTFQHAIFYNDDLEILPGPNMNLSGRIHSNSDIYVDSDSTLTIDTFYFYSAGNIYNRRKDINQTSPGEVSIRVNKPGAPKYEDMANLDSEDPKWLDEAISRWNGTVKSAGHGVTKATAPSVASIQPDGYYRSKADVVITNGVITKGGVVLREGVDYPPSTITTTTTLYNNREGKYVKTTNIDLSLLAGGKIGNVTYPNNLPSNGLIYATRDDAGITYQPGIRLINGTEIKRAGGLTVVSNVPVYIQGNFNTVGEKPASVISDSINLLSNSWEDSNSTKSLNSRKATTTSVNCAFIAGIDTTTEGHYNGGLENYPRLHEAWSGITLNIKGSFVQLWNSTVATGAWRYGNPQYTAPNRNWSYNRMFDNVSNLPPFTPWAVEADRIAWWKD